MTAALPSHPGPSVACWRQLCALLTPAAFQHLKKTWHKAWRSLEFHRHTKIIQNGYKVINYKINHVKSNSMPQSISYLSISAQYGNVNHVIASRPGRMLLVSFTAASKSAKRKCSRKSSVRLSHTGSHELGMNETSQTPMNCRLNFHRICNIRVSNIPNETRQTNIIYPSKPSTL